MQTFFSLAQLADPDVAEANKILRACVHCGFCTATCPTYVLLGDELDSPRGRIYLMKEMLEQGRPADATVVTHIDRCLSCLSCMTTCPSSVHYMHLVDQGRAHIESTYRRPLHDRLLRALLATVLPRPGLFRLALAGAWLLRPLAGLLRGAPGVLGRFGAMLGLAPARLQGPSPDDRPQVFPAQGPRRKRVALLVGCAQPVLAPHFNAATIRLLARHGCEVVVAEGAGCCGALAHHMGKTDASHVQAAANIRAWAAEIDGAGLDAVVINASGCGTTVKDYGFMFRDDPALASDAARVAALAKDVTEVMAMLGLGPVVAGPGAGAPALTVAYHSACSMQHGQKITKAPKELLARAGFAVRDVPEGHLCCGSAGTYNLLQPELALRRRDRKLANIAATTPDVIATGNIGCAAQLATGTATPIVHTVELLDWATGGPVPMALAGLQARTEFSGAAE
ncbi:MAG: 4Fe-4S dicluster domain-containing protein [Alphaproteobacteria bacterium]|nr:4Fe-4S dicluster domain-containing protein [Alphaproteobacteria bacterium]